MSTAPASAPFRRAAGGVAARVEYAGWVLAVVAAVYVVVTALDLAAVVRVRAALPAPALDVLKSGQGLGVGEVVLFIGLLLAALAWRLLAARTVDELREERGDVLRSGFLVAFQVGVAATVIAGGVLPTADLMATHDFDVRLRWMIPILVARLLLAVVLGVAVWRVRGRIHAALLRSGVAAVPRGGEPRMTLLELSKRAAAIKVPPPPADDSWWSEVAARVSSAPASLALLEVVDDERHWHVLEPGADMAAVRAAIRPGATVTLLPAVDTDPSDDPDALSAVVPG
ncbi:hypothetical protein ACQP00_23050 [Dactylosporangium sp. CS-047395]|uniref:hypothetical protein n=1 Tax=Dactylosporangium sp. CS-047395 TaxID=3239936 RepID=UPI003D94F4D5